ncbi:MAG: hypothetical protein JRI72_00135 [Deltaproteobacteria bacterium]|nr:hypothetical protein [Deltaproteobacteria bacterium]
MDIRCFTCSKMFGELKNGSVLITPSTEIDFNDRRLNIEIKCPRCKKKTSILLDSADSTGIDDDII